MIPDVRRHLHKSWGLCPRHAWLEAVVESELRTRPHGTALLYDDLLGRALTQLTSGLARTSSLRRLRAHASCYTCDYLLHAPTDPPDTATTNSGPTARVNRRHTVRALVVTSRPEWEPTSCPVCLGGNGPICRPHLLEGIDAPLEPIGAALRDVSARLALYVRSMAWGGPIPSAAERASWVEALGWFAGWAYPAALVGIDSPGGSASDGEEPSE